LSPLSSLNRSILSLSLSLSLSLTRSGIITLLFSLRQGGISVPRREKSRASRKYRDDTHNAFIVARRGEKLPKNGGDMRHRIWDMSRT
jgi:hypothetical protein